MKGWERWVRLARDGVLLTLIAAVPIMIDARIVVGAGPQSKFYLFEFGTLLALILTLPLFVARSRRITITCLQAAALAMLVYAVFRAAIDPLRDYAFNAGMQTISWLLFALLVGSMIHAWRDARRLLLALAITQTVPVLYAAIETFGVDIYFTFFRGEPGVRWTNPRVGEDRALIWTSMGNPNYYAAYAGPLLIWLLGLSTLLRTLWGRALALLFASVVVYTLIFSYARGVWVSLAATGLVLGATFVYLFITRQQGLQAFLRRYGWRCAVGAAAILALVGGLYVAEGIRGGGPLHAIGKRFHDGLSLRDASLRARPLMWTGALRMWRDAPVVGQGHGRYGPLFLQSLYNVSQETESERVHRITRQLSTVWSDHAHNEYVQYLAEIGLIGYGLFLLILISAFWTSFASLRDKRRTWPERAILTSAFAVTLFIASHCVFDFPLRLPASAMMFGLALGVIIGLTKQDARFTLKAPLLLRLPIAIILMVVALAGQTLVIQHFVASHLMTQGMRNNDIAIGIREPAAQRARLQLARDYLSRALELYPNYGEALFQLGRCQLYLHNHLSAGRVDYRRLARANLEKAEETFALPDVYLILGLLNLELFNFEPAQRQANILLMVNPELKQAQYLAGMVNLRLNRPDEALRHLRLEVRNDPGNDEAWWMIGLIYEDHLNAPEAAADAYERSLRQRPGVIRRYERLARLYADSLSDLDNALRHARTALRLAEGHAPEIVNQMRALVREIEDRG